MSTTKEESDDLIVKVLCEKRPDIVIQFLLRCEKCKSFRDHDSKCPACGRAFLSCRKCGTSEKFILCEQKKCDWTQEQWDQEWLEFGIELGLLHPDGSHTEKLIEIKKRQKEEGIK